MKILIVCSGNSNKNLSPFIEEQGNSLLNLGVYIDYFLIQGHGILGYLLNLPKLFKKIRENKYDLIHAHYGLSGLFSVIPRGIPVVITFHGSDINFILERQLSKIASRNSAANIFVSKKTMKLMPTGNSFFIPCGVDFKIFYQMDRRTAKQKLDLNDEVKYILFSSGFENKVKNYPLAKKAVSILTVKTGEIIELLELKKYNREEVALLMNAVDVALLTSSAEGSPQFIKESMACNLPIVSTDVGDVKEIIGHVDGCYISSFDPYDVAEKLNNAIIFGKKTSGCFEVKKFDIDVIAHEIVDVYKTLLNH
jgi:teichuronic acid biosynthesis glycosyltransferase TuaC